MAVNQRVQSAATRGIESCRRVERIADGMLEEMEEVTPIHGVVVSELDDEDSAVIAITEVLESGKSLEIEPIAAPPKRRARTEPGVR